MCYFGDYFVVGEDVLFVLEMFVVEELEYLSWGDRKLYGSGCVEDDFVRFFWVVDVFVCYDVNVVVVVVG